MTEQATIKLRIDVDYPYPSSRLKSFLYIALGIKSKKSESYLKNASVIAKMINDSPRKVMAYWFFTPYTIPGKKLLDLLNPEHHEIGLHIAKEAIKEWQTLEKETGRKVQYYTHHGTSSLFAQLLWRRKLGQKQATIPSDFLLQRLPDGTSLDRRIYEAGLDSVLEEAKKWISQGTVIAVHPEWLFKKGEKNRRGPFHEALKIILDVD